jgi:D-beta-D-heptose 7-phosphate kinase/D-beta-D-heptose 1-phosphate adenosyltransferase
MNKKYFFNFSDETSRENLGSLLAGLRLNKAGRIVFTNGCFDILHTGHLRYLTQARSAGGFLIIGLNTDASVARNKGPKRPIVPQDERAEMLCGLECVDCVVLFDEETPAEIIQFIKPDVLVKGAQYEEKDIVGADFIRASGGTLLRAEMIENTSTTNIIEKILKLGNDSGGNK